MESSVTLPVELEEVFPFFSEARNLELLTPPWLKFEVLTPGPIHMRRGAKIDYRLKLHGVPVRWQSEITCWEPPLRFVDEQQRGPYRLWRHEHLFTANGSDTVAQDSVEYAVPGGFLIERFFVRPDLDRVFAYRRAKLIEIFGAKD
ncbi:MAG: SRPBCC family protein [Bryobacterales bacterium]|nr:SRPBCC family protein [Bryobacterales bacterium]